jgi:hypothetical protein
MSSSFLCHRIRGGNLDESSLSCCLFYHRLAQDGNPITLNGSNSHFVKESWKPGPQIQQRFNNRSADIFVGSDAFVCNRPTRMSALLQALDEYARCFDKPTGGV